MLAAWTGGRATSQGTVRKEKATRPPATEVDTRHASTD